MIYETHTPHVSDENLGRVQGVGTSMLLYGPIVYQFDFEHSGKDDTWIGRWVIIVFQGSKGIETRIVCGYNSRYNKKMKSRTSYQQKPRYLILKEKDRTCPRKRLYDDLLRQLQDWIEERDRIIICMDASNYIYNKILGKSITTKILY